MNSNEPTNPTNPTTTRLQQLAGRLYDRYCAAVGGRAFNGDPLPGWNEFLADPAKSKQSNAWIEAAREILAELAPVPVDASVNGRVGAVVAFAQALGFTGADYLIWPDDNREEPIETFEQAVESCGAGESVVCLLAVSLGDSSRCKVEVVRLPDTEDDGFALEVRDAK